MPLISASTASRLPPPPLLSLLLRLYGISFSQVPAWLFAFPPFLPLLCSCYTLVSTWRVCLCASKILSHSHPLLLPAPLLHPASLGACVTGSVPHSVIIYQKIVRKQNVIWRSLAHIYLYLHTMYVCALYKYLCVPKWLKCGLGLGGVLQVSSSARARAGAEAALHKFSFAFRI